MKAPTVFISYSHADSPFVDKLVDKLRTSGVDVWIDKWKIKVGESIVEKVHEGIGNSDFLVVVLSKASIASKWVKEELNSATLRNIEADRHAFVLPLLIEPVEIPSLLRHRKYADFRTGFDVAFAELLEAIQPNRHIDLSAVLPRAKGTQVTIERELLDSVSRGRCILVLGEMAHFSSPEGSLYSFSDPPPSRAELARHLAAACQYPNDDITNLPQVSQFFEAHTSRPDLVAQISKQLSGYRPSPLLHMLAALPFAFVVTVSYHTLFEQALRATEPKKRYQLRHYCSEFSETEDLADDPDATNPLIFKLFGGVDLPDSLVVTDRDEIRFAQRMAHYGDRNPLPMPLRFYLRKWPRLCVGLNPHDHSFRLLSDTLEWGYDPARYPHNYLVWPATSRSDATLSRYDLRIIDENIWDFVPSLFEGVLGKRPNQVF